MSKQNKKLRAVNRMLLTIGEQPVNSLETQGIIEAELAKMILEEVSTDIQCQDWHFNKNRRVTLTPDRKTGEVTLPENCLRVDSVGRSACLNVVQRNNRLYDQLNNTYFFKEPVVVDMVVELPLEELPPFAYTYITTRATRIFQQSAVGSQVVEAFTRDNEEEALAALKQADNQNADHNILYGNRTGRRAVRRDRYL